jgi:phenylalanyl-tRNA synthetase alpha chain
MNIIDNIKNQLDNLNNQIYKDLLNVNSKKDCLELKYKYLGRKGELQKLFQFIPHLSFEEKKEIGLLLNTTKEKVTYLFEEQLSSFKEKNVVSEGIDLTLPSEHYREGALHPISLILEEIEIFFSRFGFQSIQYTKEIDTTYNNFDSLNIKNDHPARSQLDTFYLAEEIILRTHTSNCQSSFFKEIKNIPYRILISGAVYRRDSDSTHTPMFHQVEGIWIDEKISFADLINIQLQLLFFILGHNMQYKIRSAHFPFTEPSIEIDIMGPHGEWLEIVGCGMIQNNILENFQEKSSLCRGFAFGMGLERLAMIKFGIKNIRQLFQGDIRIINQFKGC